MSERVDLDEIEMRWAGTWSESDDGEVRPWLDDIARLIAEIRLLRDAIEIMATRVTPHGERDDGTTLAYIVADSTWHRVLSIARHGASEAAEAALDRYRDALAGKDPE
jgi:hypothetical protein